MRRVNWNSWLSDICIILFAAAFSLFLNQLFVIGEIASLSEAYAKVGQDQFTQSFELGLLLYCVCSPILEELLFRLIVQKGLNFLFHTGVRGRRIVLVVSALAFACYHGNVVQGLFAFPMGIFMALFYELLGNVAAPILFHVSANLDCEQWEWLCCRTDRTCSLCDLCNSCRSAWYDHLEKNRQ